MTRVRGVRSTALALAVAFLAPVFLAACGGGGGGTATLTWYINPDNGSQQKLAAQCTAQSGGAYKLTTQLLPNAADQQREQLVRRLAAKDSSISLMSLDPVFVAEFANAGFLMPITNPDDIKTFTDGVLPAPLQTVYWKGKLIAAPFWANTQLLWYRKSAAQQAGVDPNSSTFTWQQMIDAATKIGRTVAAQGNRYEGLTVWVNALVESAGGSILAPSQQGGTARPAVDSPAGRQAADIIGALARSRAAASNLSTADEDATRTTFQGPQGAFMVNWIYVYGAAQEAVSSGTLSKSVLDDIAWARYPRVDANTPSKPPLGGIDLAIGDFTKHKAQALAAARCITSLPSQTQYMLSSSNPSARAASYDDPKVLQKFPMAALIRDSIASAGPRPLTPFYPDVSGSIQRTWHPPRSVTSSSTPARSSSLMRQILAGERLL